MRTRRLSAGSSAPLVSSLHLLSAVENSAAEVKNASLPLPFAKISRRRASDHLRLEEVSIAVAPAPLSVHLAPSIQTLSVPEDSLGKYEPSIPSSSLLTTSLPVSTALEPPPYSLSSSLFSTVLDPLPAALSASRAVSTEPYPLPASPSLMRRLEKLSALRDPEEEDFIIPILLNSEGSLGSEKGFNISC